jgi:hypothetical protein
MDVRLLCNICMSAHIAGGKQKTPGVGVGAKKAGRLLKKEGRHFYLAQQKFSLKIP